jgi:putative FmdB family regulatory protein
MPTYEYRCEACGHTFEQFQSITAEPIKVCPECSKAKVRRLIGTGAALLFKGNGFYKTDYRSSTYTSAAKADSPSTAPSTGASSSVSNTGGSTTSTSPTSNSTSGNNGTTGTGTSSTGSTGGKG